MSRTGDFGGVHQRLNIRTQFEQVGQDDVKLVVAGTPDALRQGVGQDDYLLRVAETVRPVAVKHHQG